MKKVPHMLSTKDTSYIEDMFNWNITAYQKCEEYLKKVTNKELQSELKKISKMHYKNCDKLVKYIGGFINE